MTRWPANLSRSTLLALTVTVVSSVASAQATYDLVYTPLPPGYDEGFCVGINNFDDAVGVNQALGVAPRSFLFVNGVMTEIKPFDFVANAYVPCDNAARDINDAGTIIGDRVPTGLTVLKPYKLDGTLGSGGSLTTYLMSQPTQLGYGLKINNNGVFGVTSRRTEFGSNWRNLLMTGPETFVDATGTTASGYNSGSLTDISETGTVISYTSNPQGGYSTQTVLANGTLVPNGSAWFMQGLSPNGLWRVGFDLGNVPILSSAVPPNNGQGIGLPRPGNLAYQPRDMNDADEIIGIVYVGSSILPVIWRNRTTAPERLSDIIDPALAAGRTDWRLVDINACGVIVGFARTTDGKWRGFVATPKGGFDLQLYINDYMGNYADRTAKVELLSSNGSTVLVSSPRRMNALGEFTFPSTRTGGFQLRIKPDGCLSRVHTTALVPPFRTYVGVQYTPGDIDNDNEISILDYLSLSAYFERNSTDGLSPAWTQKDASGIRPKDADIDGDGEVSILDYLRLSAAFGQSGQ